MENLSACVDAITASYIRNDFLLNPNKTEALFAGTRKQHAKFDTSRGVAVSGMITPFVRQIRVLSVLIDSELSFSDHIAAVVRSCNYHIRALRNISNLIDRDTSNRIDGSTFDFWNAILYGIIEYNNIVGSSETRTHCHVLSSLHHTGLPAFVYDDHYNGF